MGKKGERGGEKVEGGQETVRRSVLFYAYKDGKLCVVVFLCLSLSRESTGAGVGRHALWVQLHCSHDLAFDGFLDMFWASLLGKV